MHLQRKNITWVFFKPKKRNLSKIINYIKIRPLTFLLFLAFFIRLIAVFFAKGYMMFDDHYLIVEPAGGWADGVDINKWLPSTPDNQGPHFMSFFYVGIIWIIFEVFSFIGIEEATNQMFWLRMLHALYSILTVYFAYKITLKLSDKKSAFLVGLILALLAYFPNFSVKQLVEMVCIPPLLGAYYYLLKDEKYNLKNVIIAGVLCGLAVGIRYQVGLIFVGVGLIYIFQISKKR